MYFTIIFRTIILYIFIVICYRIMGKKEIGELGIIDLIVSFSIAELASISIEEVDKSIWTSILPITILSIIEITMSYIGMKNSKFRKLTDGNPSIIINDGKINYTTMKRLRYTLDDLLTQLREKDVLSLEEVKYAVLETDGELSVFKKNYEYPMPLILDGNVDKETLKNIGKNERWMSDTLKKNKVTLNEVFYAFYNKNKVYIIKKGDLI